MAYIGHCYLGNCNHAYAVTPAGARKVLRLTDWCQVNKAHGAPGGEVAPIDNQWVELCGAQAILKQRGGLKDKHAAAFASGYPYDLEQVRAQRGADHPVQLRCAFAQDVGGDATNPEFNSDEFGWSNGLLQQFHGWIQTH